MAFGIREEGFIERSDFRCLRASKPQVGLLPLAWALEEGTELAQEGSPSILGQPSIVKLRDPMPRFRTALPPGREHAKRGTWRMGTVSRILARSTRRLPPTATYIA